MTRFTWSLLALPCLLATGCITANRYGTARTLPEGEGQHLVSAELGVTGAFFDPEPDEELEARFLRAPIPTYTYRHGLGERVEFGVGVGTLFGIAADLKLQLIRSDAFDLAVAPTLGVGILPLGFDDAVLATGTLPLLAGINLHPDVTLIPHAMATVGSLSAFDPDVSGGDVAVAYSWGAALRVRAFEELSIAPTFAMLAMPEELERFYLFGIAFHIGAQADYGSSLDQPVEPVEPLE